MPTDLKVKIPTEDSLARLIGKGGENITAFEKITKTSVLFGETPLTLIVRGETTIDVERGKLVLEELAKKNTITPGIIEDIFKTKTRE